MAPPEDFTWASPTGIAPVRPKHPNPPAWAAKTGSVAWWLDRTTLFCSQSAKSVEEKLTEVRTPPVSSADGRTLLVSVSPAAGSQLLMLDTTTLKVTKVAQSEKEVYVPIGYVSARRAFIFLTVEKQARWLELADMMMGRFTLADRLQSNKFKAFLVHPETLKIQPTEGEVAPFLDWTDRGTLQPADDPTTYWWAHKLPDQDVTEVGLYDTKLFRFTPRIRYPGILFSARQMWVDRPAGKVYVSYRGYLLRMPIPP